LKIPGRVEAITVREGDRVDVLIPDSDQGQEVVRRSLDQNNISVSAIEANEPTLVRGCVYWNCATGR